MDRTAMWLFSALFFGSLPVTALILIVMTFSPSESLAKATGVFLILLVTGLLGMVGINILSRFASTKEHAPDARSIP